MNTAYRIHGNRITYVFLHVAIIQFSFSKIPMQTELEKSQNNMNLTKAKQNAQLEMVARDKAIEIQTVTN